MKSVFLRPTGRMIEHQSQLLTLKPHEIARNNEIHEPVFLDDTRGKVLRKVTGEVAIPDRLNAAGDSAELASGYQIVIDTLTYLSRQVSEQKFYKVPFADYLPVAVGEGAYANNLLFNRSYSVGDDFESGNINQGTGDARLSMTDTMIDGVTQPTMFWGKEISWNIIDVNQALLANSWDPIMARMEARKENWDLGLQITAFFGLASDTRFPGLLNNSAWTVDTGTVPTLISAMTATQFQTFLGAFIQAYITNVGSTAMPDTFIMPQRDYIACCQVMVQNLIAGGAGTFVGMTIMDYLLMMFKRATMNEGFQIKPLYYADKAVNNAARGLNLNYYALYRRDPKSLRMNIPIDYTVLNSDTLNNFNFYAVAYGQYTGVIALRALECIIFTNNT